MSSETNIQLFPGVFRSTVGGTNPGFFLHSDGRVGIGNTAPDTPPAWNTDTTFKLNVTGHTHVNGNLDVSGHLYGDGSTLSGVAAVIGGYWDLDQANNNIKYEVGNVGIGGAASSTNELKVHGTVEATDLTVSGNVGIGTSDAITKLQVTTNDDSGTSSTVALSLYAQSSDHTQIQNGFGSRLMFYTNRGTSSTYRGASAEIKGYIWSGAGGTADYHALDINVYGDNGALNQGISIKSSSSTANTPANTTIHGNVGIGGAVDTEKLKVYGDILATANVTAYSDRRLKSDIVKIKDALNKIDKLNGYTYTMNDKRSTGLIAQEVLKVLPEAVEGSEETTYALAYGNLASIFVEAIKELREKILDLENKIQN